MSRLAALPKIPRYTSYPTAPHFNKSRAEFAQTILYSTASNAPVSVYIHIPFCDRLCWFCGCHTKHTKKYDPIKRYVDALVCEIDQFSAKTETKPKLAFLHFGGGSPSMLHPNEAGKIISALKSAFEFLPDVEISLEVDPTDASQTMYEALLTLGVNRISLGVQDFNWKVQAAINRPQTFEDTAAMIETLRASGITSLNVDALYGLPFQTCETITKTIDQVLGLKPDRVALFGYAHVPSIKKHQRLIDETSLPNDHDRMAQASIARNKFIDAAYEPIGIDHFALKNDKLAQAKFNGTLHRNFQGYTTDTAETLIGFGASSISSNKNAYVQNVVATGNYQKLIEEKRSVAERGFILSRDDQIRGFIIKELMCGFGLNFEKMRQEFPTQADAYIEEAFEVAAADGGELCEIKADGLIIHDNKHSHARIIASKFDAYLDKGKAVYSKAV